MHQPEPQPGQQASDRAPGGYQPGQPDQTRVYPTVEPPAAPGASAHPGASGPRGGAAASAPVPPGGAARGGPTPGVYGRPARARKPLNLKVRLTDALIAGGALLVFLFSFAPFVEYDDPDLERRLEQESLPTWFSAWALETFMAPLTWWVIIAALGMLAIIALQRFVPDQRLLGFQLSQIQLMLSYFALIMLLGYALSAKTMLFGSELQDESFASQFDTDMSSGWGANLMLFGALATAVGATLGHLGVDPLIWPPPAKPETTAHQAAQPGWGQQPGQPGQTAQQGYPATPYPQQPGHGYSPPHGYAPPTQQMPQATPPDPATPPGQASGQTSPAAPSQGRGEQDIDPFGR
ncbi:MAG: hypothetical protein GEU94_21305 [Micromonosporaceae bacterium]|nr:hypothetical protein [Micromonosporaceae bacterium]